MAGMSHFAKPDVTSSYNQLSLEETPREVIPVPDRRAETVKRVLRSAVSRNGVPRVSVSDNAPKFADVNLCEWLSRIGYQSVKTPLHVTPTEWHS